MNKRYKVWVVSVIVGFAALTVFGLRSNFPTHFAGYGYQPHPNEAPVPKNDGSMRSPSAETVANAAHRDATTGNSKPTKPILERVTGRSAAVLTVLQGDVDFVRATDRLKSVGSTTSDVLTAEALTHFWCQNRQMYLAQEKASLLAAQRAQPGASIDEIMDKVLVKAKSEKHREALVAFANRNLARRCVAFDDSQLTQDEIDKRFAAAAQNGSSVAKIYLIAKRIDQSSTVEKIDLPGIAPTSAAMPKPMTANDRAELLGLILSKDPAVIVNGGPIFTQGTMDQSVLVGAARTELGKYADEIWVQVACAFGFECGEQNNDVFHECVNSGKCYASYAAYLSSKLSAADYQNILLRSDEIVRGILNQDPSLFVVADQRARDISAGTSIPRFRFR
jgi:hypothetical protein